MAGRDDDGGRDDDLDTNIDDDAGGELDDDGGQGDGQGDDGETREELMARLKRMDRQLRRANREAERLRTAVRRKPDDDRSRVRSRDLDGDGLDDDGLDDDDRDGGRDRDDGDRSRSGRRGRDDDRDRDDRDRARRDKAAAALQRKLAEADREAVRWRERAIRSEVASGLAKAGADPERIDRLAKLVDDRDLEFDDRGDLVGLGDQIEEIKEDFPELFKAKPRAGRVRARGRDDDGDDDDGEDDGRRGRRGVGRGVASRVGPGPRRSSGGEPKSSAELIAAQIAGARR